MEPEAPHKFSLFDAGGDRVRQRHRSSSLLFHCFIVCSFFVIVPRSSFTLPATDLFSSSMEMKRLSLERSISSTCLKPIMYSVTSFSRESRKAHRCRCVPTAPIPRFIAYIRHVLVGSSPFFATDLLADTTKEVCLGSSNISMFITRFSGDSQKVVSCYIFVHCIFCRCSSPAVFFRFGNHDSLVHRISPLLPPLVLPTLSAARTLKICIVDETRHSLQVSEQAPICHVGCLFCSGEPLSAHCFSGVVTTPSTGEHPIRSLAPFLVSENQKPCGLLSWARPNLINDLLNPQSSPLRPKFNDMDFVALMILARLQRIFGGFTGAFDSCITSYFSFLKNNLSVDSSEWVRYLYLLSMKRDDFSNSLTSFDLSFSINEGWFSASLYVTISLLSDFVAKATPMHSSFVLNLMSSSYEELSCLFHIVVVYAFNQRRWIIPSNLCNQAS